MILKYHLKKSDILFGRMCLMITNKTLCLFTVLIIGFLTYTTCSSDEFHQASPAVKIVFVILAAAIVTFLYFALQIALHLVMVYSGKHQGVAGSHTLEIKEDGLEESTDVNRSLHRWNASFKIKEFGGYVWIYHTDGQFFMIPKRRGGHEGDLAGFVSQLRAKLQ